MIRLFRTEGGELHPVDTGNMQDALWIDAVAPSPDEVERIHRMFDVDLQDVADCLDPNERSRVEIEEKYDLLVLRSLLTVEKDVDRIETMPIGIFVTHSKVITFRVVPSFSYQELTADYKKRPRIDTKEDLFLAITRRVTRDIERRVKPMERTIFTIQQKILSQVGKDVAQQAFALSNGLILLNTSLLSNLNATSMLSRARQLHFSKEKLDLAEDIENEISQLYEMTTIYREIMSNILNAYESAIANSLSTVMKTLTSISLILILPMLIASLFSMNVGLPFEKSPYAFWVVISLSASAVVALWVMFRLKRIL